MSPDFSRRPKKVKGAIMALMPDPKHILIDPDTPALIFQYNPETLTHAFSSPECEEVLERESKPDTHSILKPRRERKRDVNSILELISLTLEFDAADQLEAPEKNKDVVENGLHPALAVLESIMSSQFKIRSTMAPVLIFLFGRNRTVPVWLDSLKVIEEAFDPNLNPIRVRIELIMRVRALSEFKKGSLGYAICAGHLNRRRILAKLYPQNGTLGGLVDQVNRSIQ